MSRVTGPWRARWRARFEYELDRMMTFEAWIGATDRDQASELLRQHLAGAEVVEWHLEDLLDATAGEPGVIATWEF